MRSIYKFNLCFSLILLLLYAPFVCQTEESKKFNRLEFKRGFSKQAMTAIVQDEKGFMWFGTRNGLYRYDGYSFLSFKHDPLSNNSISNNVIRNLQQAGGGNIWIISESDHVDLLNVASGSVTNYSLPNTNLSESSPDQVAAVSLDQNGTLWVSERLGGLYYFSSEDNRFVSFVPDVSEMLKMEDARILQFLAVGNDELWLSIEGIGPVILDVAEKRMTILSEISDAPYDFSASGDAIIFEDSQGIIRIGTWGGGLYKFDPEQNRLVKNELITTARFGEGANFIKYIAEDSHQNLWIVALDAGIIVLNTQTGSVEQYQHDKTDPNSLVPGQIETLYEDYSDTMWIGSSDGLGKYSRYKYKFGHSMKESTVGDGSSNYVVSIFEDSSENLWISTIEVGLRKFESGRSQPSLIPIIINGVESASSVTAIREDESGNLYIGTGDSGLLRYEVSTNSFTSMSKPQFVSDILTDSKGVLWIATYVNGLGSLDRGEGTFSYWKPPNISGNFDATVLFEDSSENLWIGSDGNGMIKLLPDRQQFIRFQKNEDTSPSLSDDRVLTITEDDAAFIWVGTRNGLNKIDPCTSEVTRYYEKDFLPDNTICLILKDESGILWISTFNGLLKLNPESQQSTVYGSDDGLQDYKFNPGTGFRSGTGRLYFGGVNGYNSFVPSELAANTRTPNMVITTFRKFDQIVPFNDNMSDNSEIKLKHNENFFSIEFSFLDFTNPVRNKYEYILEGIDPEWVRSADRRYASYTNVQPGHYTFRVRGSNNDGIWSGKDATLNIHIIPPFWMTWEFRILMLLLLFVLSISAYKLRTRAIKRQRDKLQLEVEERRVAEGRLMGNQARLREMASRLTIAEEMERRRISGALHDKIGHALFFMKVKIAEQEKKNRLDELSNWFAEMKNLLDETIEQTRSLTVEISPPSLHKFGLVSAAERMVEQFGEKYGIKTIISKKEHNTIDYNIAVLLYQSLRELLMNVVKHAQAEIVNIRIINDGGNVIINMKDDGKGFDPAELTEDSESTEFGLYSINERMESIGGKFDIYSSPGEGTEVILTAPLSKE